MKIHWGAKWISLPYEGTTAVLQGILSELQVGGVSSRYGVAVTQFF
jgi:hypothetical protein